MQKILSIFFDLGPDASSNISEVWGVGLFFAVPPLTITTQIWWPFSFVPVTTLAVSPSWRFSKAALASLKWKASDAKTWEAPRHGTCDAAQACRKRTGDSGALTRLEERLKELHEKAPWVLRKDEEA